MTDSEKLKIAIEALEALRYDEKDRDVPFDDRIATIALEALAKVSAPEAKGHTERWSCINPNGDGCDGNHIPEAVAMREDKK